MPISQAKIDHHAPIFPVTDMERALDYYKAVLGFNILFEWEDEEENGTRYAILERDDCSLHLTLSPRPHRVAAYFFVDGIKALYNEMKRRKALTTEELQDMPWDMKEFEVSDQDGNLMIFGEALSR